MIRMTAQLLIASAIAALPTVGIASVDGNDCTGCHAVPQGVRYGVMAQMTSQSHHVQGVKVTGRHCYACHWEANSDGSVNERFHEGSRGLSRESIGGAGADLVVWGEGKRPERYRLHSTATIFRSSRIGTDGERREAAQVTIHCLGCHNDRNNGATPFEGDVRTPGAYAWDRQSIASRYSRRDVARWGKYSTLTGSGKSRVVKAFSAHGNTAGNTRGRDPFPDAGSVTVANVECFDCHNSHGSTVGGVTSSYPTFGGGFTGGILKQTEKGRGGYAMGYAPARNPDPAAVNPYHAGAALCFDCHENRSAGPAPWGYSTFGAATPVVGFKDTPRFGPGVKESSLQNALRPRRTAIAGSHLKAGRMLNYSTHGEIRGICTGCHDPHGVSRTLGELMPYALPLLKGTWLTSPYPEDSPPTDNKRSRSGNPPASFGIFEMEADRLTGTNYHIDRNTFAGNGRIIESDTRFAGLCFRCHARERFRDDTRTGRIHRAVKGWGNNREHAFPCSKCHQPHTSGLPRLMQTNCFAAGPVGLRDGVTVPWSPDAANSGNGKKEPVPGAKGVSRESVVGCHIRRSVKGRSQSTNNDNGGWRVVNGW